MEAEVGEGPHASADKPVADGSRAQGTDWPLVDNQGRSPVCICWPDKKASNSGSEISWSPSISIEEMATLAASPDVSGSGGCGGCGGPGNGGCGSGWGVAR